MFTVMSDELNKIQLSLMRMENKQVALLNDIKPLLDEIKSSVRDTRYHGLSGLQQIRSRCSGLSNNNAIMPLLLLDEDLPNDFYHSVADKLEHKLTYCINEIRYFATQLKTRMDAMDASKGGKGKYGQIIRIGSKQILELIKYQNESFMSITALVAIVHREVAEVKEVFLRVLAKKHEKSNAGTVYEASCLIP